MNARSFVATAAFCVLAASCVDEEAPERTGASAAAIVGGAPDEAHPAVVLLRSAKTPRGVRDCTGTLVKVDVELGVGWVLTAGHCVDAPRPVVVVRGRDPNAASAREHAVLDVLPTPYSGEPTPTSRDLAVVRILGVDGSTPVLKLAGIDDGLAVGSVVTSVGYGRTTPDGPDPAPPGRRSITRRLTEVTSTTLAYAMSDGGVCSGDSGGPVVATVAGEPVVVGVHSYVDPDCTGTGTSMRVGAERAWLDAQLAAVPPRDVVAVPAPPSPDHGTADGEGTPSSDPPPVEESTSPGGGCALTRPSRVNAAGAALAVFMVLARRCRGTRRLRRRAERADVTPARGSPRGIRGSSEPKPHPA